MDGEVVVLQWCSFRQGRLYLSNIQKNIENFSVNVCILESPKIKLSHDLKNMNIAFRNKKLIFHLRSSSFLFGFFSFYFYLFIFLKIMRSLIPYQQYRICPNWQNNIDMVNKNKKCDMEFWSDFKQLTFFSSMDLHGFLGAFVHQNF